MVMGNSSLMKKLLGIFGLLVVIFTATALVVLAVSLALHAAAT